MLTALVMVIVVAACSGSGPQALSAKAAPGSDSGKLATLLAGAGIATVEQPGAEPIAEVAEPLGITLTEWQVASMARQIEAKQGYRGVDLNALVTDAGAKVPIAAVLAGWLAAAETPAADAARSITGEQ
ncbi:MAG: hypothetical protein EOO74_07615, partial [Myxococcales bacterium]